MLTNPIITGYQYRAFPLSIIGTHAACFPWIFENFIQLRCSKSFEEPQRAFDFADPNLLYNPTPWLATQRLEKAFSGDHAALQRLVIDSLQNNHYVYLYVDEYFIPNRVPFGKAHIPHDILISGYDDATATFEVAGFDEQGTYQQTQVTYLQFQQATQATVHNQLWPVAHNQLLLLRLNSDACYSFALSHVKELLTAYLMSTIPSYPSVQTQPVPDSAYGLEVYEMLQRYVQLGQEHHIEPETRPFQMLLEHKQLMQRRLAYLQTLGYLDQQTHLTQKYAEIAKVCLAARNALIKYQITDQERLLAKIQAHMITIQKQERDVLNELIEKLPSSHKDR